MNRNITYSSDEYKYSEEDAYASAIQKVIHNHRDYHIISTINTYEYCDECNDYHYYCEILIEKPHNAPTDLEVELRKLFP